jgi:hypothetical protein
MNKTGKADKQRAFFFSSAQHTVTTFNKKKHNSPWKNIYKPQ